MFLRQKVSISKPMAPSFPTVTLPVMCGLNKETIS